ncbi:MAG: redox-regulated ATPase YchF, partial [Patescibacteria group bacterium]
EVPDARLAQLATISKSKKTVPTIVEFVDIAGLVQGASKGEGLGNKFLAHIREVDAIVQVVRGFSDPNVIHVHNKVDPNEDVAVIETELALADLDGAKKRLEQIIKQMRSGADKKLLQQKEVLEEVVAGLEQGSAVRDHARFAEFKELFRDLQLLTAKPQLIVVNTDDGAPGTVALNTKSPVISISARLEAELADLSPEEAVAYLKELGIEQSGLDKLIVAGYALLDLITFLTSGEPETRAWTVRAGATAPQAAGVIHTDFEKGFIRAEVVDWKDFVATGGWAGCKERGLMRLEGKDYVVRDGDVCYFHVTA